MSTQNKAFCITAIAAIGGLVGGLVAKYLLQKELVKNDDRLDAKMRELDGEIENAKKQAESIKKQANDYSDQVERAVRFVYNTEARSAFERKLKTVNLEEISVAVCKDAIRKLDDTTIKQMIRENYESQIKTVMRNELEKYFKDGIKRLIDTDIDSEFIRRTAKTYVKDEVRDVLSEEVKEAVDRCNIEKCIDDTLSNSREFSKQIRWAIDNYDYDDLIKDELRDYVDFEDIAKDVIIDYVDDMDLEEIAKKVIKHAG